MATAEECRQALVTLGEKSAARNASNPQPNSDRTLSCTLTDLKVIFGGEFRDGVLTDIHQVEDPAADIRFELSSDDLIALVEGRLQVASAWATGRVKLHAGIRDLMRLRSMF